MFLEHFKAVIKLHPQFIFINDLEKLGSIHQTSPFDIYWAALLVDAAEAAGPVLVNLFALVAIIILHKTIQSVNKKLKKICQPDTYLHNIINIKFVSVRHVVAEHFFDLGKFEFSRPAKSKVEGVVEPGIVRHLLLNYPLLELIQDMRLPVRQFS